MHYTQVMLDELNVLLMFSLDSMQEGIKIHHDADSQRVAAAQRLFDKGLISQNDGGYLTDLGRETAEHAHTLLNILTTRQDTVVSL